MNKVGQLAVLLACALVVTGSVAFAVPASEAPPPDAIIVNGCSLVPFRYIGEWLGAQVSFQASAKTITLTLAETTVHLQLGSKRALVNDETVLLISPALERGGVTYVPLRFVAETLAAKVQWDEAKRLVTVERPGADEKLVLQALFPGEVRPRDGRWVGGAGKAVVRFAVTDRGRRVGSLSLDGQPSVKGILAMQYSAGTQSYAIVNGAFGRRESGHIAGTFTTPSSARGVWHLLVWYENPRRPKVLDSTIKPRQLDWKWTAKWVGPATTANGSADASQ